jgi:2-aminoadipate transaminase
MLDAMARFFPQPFTWTRPDGGMFIWASGPCGMDMEMVNQVAMTRQTAFVPGTFFFACRGCGRETLRLNFTMAKEAALTRSVTTLGTVLNEALEKMDGVGLDQASA